MDQQTLKEKTTRGLLWGLMNNGATQVLNLVFGIVLTRMLSQGDYGLASELAIFSTIASALQESGFIAALTNRRNATQEDFNSVFWFNVSVSAGIYVILWFCAPLLVSYFGEPELLWLSRYAFIGFFVASFSIAPRAMLFRQLRAREQALTATIALVISGCTAITMALLGMTYWSIVTQGIVYVGIVSALSWHFSGFRPRLQFNFAPIREMFSFSCKLLVTNVFNTINNSIFALLFGNFYTKIEVGTYNQADKWNKMGAQLITGMVQGVAQPMFVAVGDDQERLCRVFRKMLRFTAFIAFPSMLGLAFVARPLIIVTVGEEWESSAALMQMLCVAGAFMPLAALYTNFLISRGRSSVYMWSIIAQGLGTLACVFTIKHLGQLIPTEIGIAGWSIALSPLKAMVLSYVALYICWMGLWHFFVWREIRLSLWHALRDTLPFLLTAAATMVLTALLTSWTDNIYLLLSLRIAIAALIYAGVMRLLGAEIMKECIQELKKLKGKK